MKITTESVKEVRSRTNAGILACKNALLEAGGDVGKAIEALKRRGVAIAEKKKERIVTDGIIEAYIHHTKQIGAIVELNCETDFVARTDEFRELARNLAMQVVAISPQFISLEEMPSETEMDPQIVCLLSQPFIKEPDKTVQEIITGTIAKVGENIKVRRFARFKLGC
jgi:elongation factor Ts